MDKRICSGFVSVDCTWGITTKEKTKNISFLNSNVKNRQSTYIYIFETRCNRQKRKIKFSFKERKLQYLLRLEKIICDKERKKKDNFLSTFSLFSPFYFFVLQYFVKKNLLFCVFTHTNTQKIPDSNHFLCSFSWLWLKQCGLTMKKKRNIKRIE